MSIKKPLFALVALSVLLTGIATPVLAHETQAVDGYDVTFGGADEPLITDERMWLEFEIVDTETGAPAAGHAENLTVSVQTSEAEKTPLELSEKHGEPGVYEAPVVFAEPGDYVVHLEGHLDGVDVHTHFEKTVTDRAELEYPASESEAAGNSTDSQPNDERPDEAGFGSGSIALAGLGLGTVIGAVLLRRRR
ncbi:FixH family protein [Natrinema thermotolerans]